jgi:hypothetical protein
LSKACRNKDKEIQNHVERNRKTDRRRNTETERDKKRHKEPRKRHIQEIGIKRQNQKDTETVKG